MLPDGVELPTIEAIHKGDRKDTVIIEFSGDPGRGYRVGVVGYGRWILLENLGELSQVSDTV